MNRHEPAEARANDRWLQWVYSHVDKTEPPQTALRGFHKDNH